MRRHRPARWALAVTGIAALALVTTPAWATTTNPNELVAVTGSTPTTTYPKPTERTAKPTYTKTTPPPTTPPPTTPPPTTPPPTTKPPTTPPPSPVTTTTEPAPTVPVTGPATTALIVVGAALVLGGALVLARLRRRVED